MEKLWKKFESSDGDVCVADKDTSAKHNGVENNIHDILNIANMQTSAEEVIQLILEHIGKNLSAERCYVFEEVDGKLDNTYEWVAAGVTPQIDNLQQLPMETTAVWYEYFQKNQNVVLEDIDAIKDSDPVLYNTLKPQDITSIVVGPLKEGGKIIGFYGVDNPPVEQLEYQSEMIDILSFFVMSAMRRRKLEILSMHDQLTGFLNRHALYDYQMSYNGMESIGLIYFDITGLKRVNDEQGHSVGDELLIKASNCIEEIFSEHKKFRIGGDEFIVICQGISEIELRQNISKVQEAFEDKNLVVATGATWQDKNESIKGIAQLAGTAEKDMYKSKQLFYENSGMERRRQPRNITPKTDKKIGYFTEKVHYCIQPHLIIEEQEKSIMHLLCNNGGVGIMTGLFDEDYTIDFISEPVLSILEYDSYEEFDIASKKKLRHILDSKQALSPILNNIFSLSNNPYYTTFVGKNQHPIRVAVLGSVSKDYTGKDIWMLSIRKIFK